MLKTFFLFLLVSNSILAQIKSGPFFHHITESTCNTWLQLDSTTAKIRFEYWSDNNEKQVIIIHYSNLPFGIYKGELIALEPSTNYQYRIINLLDNQLLENSSFQTKSIDYQTKKDKLSFTYGSCALLDDNPNDSIQRIFLNRSTIFKTISNTPHSFHIWGGDNVYLKKQDLSSLGGYVNRYEYNWRNQHFNSLLKSGGNYFLWDDHDYGMDNYGSNYPFKNRALNAFNLFTANPNYGQRESPGTYTSFQENNVKFILLDNRFNRTIDTLPNSEYLGQTQFEWLCQELKKSKADFNLILGGSQFSNPLAFPEGMHLSDEWNRLISFIKDEKINGVLFLSGDRHFSEILVSQSEDQYPLFEITSSPVTAKTFDVSSNKRYSAELNNPNRVKNSRTSKHSFAHFQVSGKRNRKLKVIFKDITGKKIYHKKFKQNQLKF